jgi:(1->4)-alpha-D-glucan 1-alpha-D-glucosylmutase
MLKAIREAKLHTSWLTPNEEYENATAAFVERALTGPGGARFVPAMLPFERRIAPLGLLNSLAQVTLKIGSPGVPDFYQGTDLWDLSLVDPDNRRPVDFPRRRALLDEVDAVLAADPVERARRIGEWTAAWRDGRIKLLLTAAGLRLRRDLPDLFRSGAYVPLATEVTVPGDAVAFARTGGDRAVLFVAPRTASRLVPAGRSLPLGGECWKTSRVLLPPDLAGRTYRHEVTGAELRPTIAGSAAWLFVGQIFETVPMGMLRAV